MSGSQGKSRPQKYTSLDKIQKLEKGVAGRVVQDKKPILVKDNRFDRSERPDCKTKLFVSAPLIVEERVLGVINIIDKVSGENFCETDVNLLCTIAGQVSVAVESSRLYKALEENCFNMVKFLTDSLELIQKVKNQNPDIRAIMITGNASEDVATWALRYRIDNYMKKPFNIVELKKVVKQTLCDH